MDRKENCILSVNSLKTGFRSGGSEKVVIKGFNTSVRQGELIAVIGRNGSGKSTLLRTIIGLQFPLSGTILVEGNDLQSYGRMELARKASYISTEMVRALNMTVFDLVALGRYAYTNWTGKIDSANHSVIMDALNKTGMTTMISRFIGELSDGERQRAMIARVIAQETNLMVMDEPTAFLDIGSKFEILHLLHDLSKSNNRTVIFSTHDLHLAMNHADKIWLLKNSGVVEGAPEDLMLQGEFEHIFDSASVKYNAEQGTFIFSGQPKGSIHVQGEGIMRGWTEKALSRAGFEISGKVTSQYVVVPSGSSRNWSLVSENIQTQFSSLYDLLEGLKTIA
jgi:iron complex transport system ATP-binding protein